MSKITIDLSGPDGNAFYLLGKVRQFGQQLEFSKEKQSEISKEMKSGDYDNLLSVFEKHFGEYVKLQR